LLLILLIYSCCHILAVYHLNKLKNCHYLKSNLTCVRKGRPSKRLSGLLRQHSIKTPANYINHSLLSVEYGHGLVTGYSNSSHGVIYHCLYSRGHQGANQANLNEECLLQEIELYKDDIYKQSAARAKEPVSMGSPNITKPGKRKAIRMSNISKKLK